MCLPLEEDAVCAGHKVMIKAENYSVLIVGDPQVILDEQLRLHPIHILNIIMTIILIN